MQRARRVLVANPARTLDLAEQHARTYARGSFVEEREALAIEALFGLGEHARAVRRLNAFRARFGQSIHLQRLDDLIER